MSDYPYRRRGDILRLLLQQGPLSVWGLKQMIEPEMKAKNIALSLRRLRKKGYVVRRFDSLPNNVGHFYQLSNSQLVRKDISEITGIGEDQLIYPIIRDQELYHSQLCALWMHYLQQLFPEAKMVRDFQILQDQRSKDVLMLTPERMSIRPDIMMHFPRTEKTPDLDIAIEIERSRKTDERLIQKLKKLSHETHLDGVIYVCENHTLVDIILNHFNKKVRDSVFTSQYDANFLMFMPDVCMRWGKDSYIVNCDKRSTYLTYWIDFLKAHEHNFRRNNQLHMFGDERTSENTR